MSQQFSFRLIGVDAPDGELEVDQLLALVSSLKEIATKIGRTETEADAVGRPPKRTQDVARLTIGLTPGSTKLTVQRLDQPDMLEFATESELGFDERFEAIVTSLADDEKPEWISQPLAIATEKLRNALEKTAPQIEFSVGGVLKRQFFTADTHSRTWIGVTPTVEETSITFVGRLRAVNLDTERFHITDDLSNKVSIRNVANVENLGALLDKYVVATGTPVRNESGHLMRIDDATLKPSDEPFSIGMGPAVPLEKLAQGVPGPEDFKITDLTREEMQAFWDAIG